MTFEFIPTESGLRIHDQIENVWCEIDVGHPVEPEPGDSDEFVIPVDQAIRFEVETIEFSTPFITRIYDDAGEVRGIVERSGRVQHATLHEIDCTPTGMKAYLRVDDTGIDIAIDQTTRITFDGPRIISFAVRSAHERPAGVVATSKRPRDLMAAISTFGTAMKTFSPERSFPTLRGHPPELTVKSRLQIPDHFSPPDTGIQIEVPPEIGAIFTVAPLAYYLGARVVEGSSPLLHANDESLPLDEPDLASGVATILQHCFTLDCLVRTAGLYPVDLRELELIRRSVDLDVDTLYDLPIAERTERYLSFPRDPFEEVLPWPTLTDVEPRPGNAELLPYLSYRLSAIRSPPVAAARSTDRIVDLDTEHRSAADLPGTSEPVDVVTPEPTSAHHSGWVGDAVPRSGTLPVLASYLAALDETPNEGGIDIHVVCTDSSMASEVDAVYANRSNQPLDVQVTEDASIADLESVLASGVDFLHFVGHATEHGLHCVDGLFDLSTLPAGRYPAFFLNGCESVHQGRALAQKGSVGGLVSLDRIPNDEAITAGRLIANLLTVGSTFSQTVSALERWSPLDYTAIGDGDHHICVADDYTPIMWRFDTGCLDGAQFRLQVELLGEVGRELGVVTAPAIGDDSRTRLRGMYTTSIQPDQLDAIVDTPAPLIIDDELHWTWEFTEERLWSKLVEQAETGFDA